MWTGDWPLSLLWLFHAGQLTCGPGQRKRHVMQPAVGELAPGGETLAAAEDTALCLGKAFAVAARASDGSVGRLNWLKPVCGAVCCLGLR